MAKLTRRFNHEDLNLKAKRIKFRGKDFYRTESSSFLRLTKD